MEFSFTPYNDTLRPAWDKFVTTHSQAWPGQDSAIIGFARSCGQASFSHLAYDERGQVAAVVPVFLSTRREARILRFRTLVTGSSLRGGPLLRPGLSLRVRRQFMQAWATWLADLARQERIDSIRVAFPYVLGKDLATDVYECHPLREFGFQEQRHLASLLDLRAPGDLMTRFTPECRNKIRRAERAGAEVVPVEDRATWLALHPLNVDTFKGEAVGAYSTETMGLIWDEFIARGLAHAFAVRHQGDDISCAVIAGTAHAAYTWLVFNRRPLPVPGANNLLIWHAMEWTRQRGVRYYELGSVDIGDPRTEAISTFKQSFGGRLHYGLDATLIASEIKQASADWLQAVARRLRASRRSAGATNPQGEAQVGKA